MQAEQRSPEWFKQREGRITASSVGAIMGYAPYQTREDVMRRMLFGDNFQGSAATEWGTFNESGAIFEFEMETGLKVKPAPFVPFEDWMGASPDGYVSDGRLIEVKCPFGIREEGSFKSIMEQKHYLMQIQMQLFCANLQECYFYQWTPHSTKLEIVKRDEELIEKMLIEAKEFYKEYLFNKENGYKKGFDSKELDDMMNEYQSLKKIKEDAETRQKEILQGMLVLTDNKGGEIAGHKLYKTERKGSISYSKVVSDLLPNADLEAYRGNPTISWSVR